MKKVLCILIIIMALLLTSCAQEITVRGIENFYESDYSSVELCIHLVPENFWLLFEYIEGDYKFHKKYGIQLEDNIDKALMYFKYDETNYYAAKEYILKNMSLDVENKNVCGEYIFLNNKAFGIYDLETNTRKNGFPYKYNMVGYCDTTKTLVFLGAVYPTNHEDCEIALSDFEKYMNHVWKQFLNN